MQAAVSPGVGAGTGLEHVPIYGATASSISQRHGSLGLHCMFSPLENKILGYRIPGTMCAEHIALLTPAEVALTYVQSSVAGVTA
jgi:hypothetical protein